jgi:phosphoenolpyruvate carboxykinase (ATP)
MKLGYTRAMITAALNGELDNIEFETHPIFGMHIPTSCKDVPTEILNPKNTWANKTAYDETAKKLASMFIHNFEKYLAEVDDEILAAAPKI